MSKRLYASKWVVAAIVFGGVLTAIDTSGEHADPGELDLGDRVQLIYLSPSEL